MWVIRIHGLCTYNCKSLGKIGDEEEIELVGAGKGGEWCVTPPGKVKVLEKNEIDPKNVTLTLIVYLPIARSKHW